MARRQTQKVKAGILNDAFIQSLEWNSITESASPSAVTGAVWIKGITERRKKELINKDWLCECTNKHQTSRMDSRNK